MGGKIIYDVMFVGLLLYLIVEVVTLPYTIAEGVYLYSQGYVSTIGTVIDYVAFDVIIFAILVLLFPKTNISEHAKKTKWSL